MDFTHRLFELSIDMLCVADLEGHFKELNPAFQWLLGYSLEELKQKRFTDFLHTDDQAGSLAKIESLRAGTETAYFESRCRCKDGSFKWLAWTIVPDLKQSILLIVARDLTEAKEREAHQRQTEEQRLHFLENAPDALVIINQRREILSISAQAERLLGYTKVELIGQHVNTLLPEKARRAHSGHLSTYFRHPTARRMGVGMELVAQRKNGTTVPVEISLSPVETEGEQFVMAAVRDISERKAVDEQLRQAQKMEAVGQLTGGIAHDFNNLLTVIIGNLQLFEDDVKQHEVLAAPLADALDAGLRGADLTRRLLAFSRQQLLAPNVVAVDKLVTDIEPLLRRTLGEQVNLTAKTTDNLWFTEVDRNQLENAVVNLCINARDAMPDGGQLTIETGNSVLDASDVTRDSEVTAGEYVLLSISDSGTGMQQEVLEHVFEPFYTTKEVGKGSGLGLSMVYGFVKQSKGHIDVDSEEGQGTTIRIYLPRSRSATEYTGATSINRATVPSGDETILLVEDDVAVRKIAVELLSALGYRVLEAGSAAEVLAILGDHEDIDLLFSDIVMPGGMSGIELVRHAQQSYPNLKVLLTTGYANTAIYDTNFLRSGYNVLNKPYRKEDLAQLVREVLDRD